MVTGHSQIGTVVDRKLKSIRTAMPPSIRTVDAPLDSDDRWWTLSCTYSKYMGEKKVLASGCGPAVFIVKG